MLKKSFVIVLIPCFLVACASSYQPLGVSGGYTDTAYNKDTYYVAFYPNSYTSREMAKNYVLRRSAEITLKNGYKYFVLLNNNLADNYLSFIPLPGGNSGLLTGGIADSTRMLKAEIKMLHSSDDYLQVYDAAVILSNYQK